MLYFVEMIQDRAMPASESGYADRKERVCRSLEMLAKDPQIAGGVRAAGRSVAFIVETDSNESLDRKLQDIPLWDIVDRTVVSPLVPFDSRRAYNTST
jgi:hypothetical protein